MPIMPILHNRVGTFFYDCRSNYTTTFKVPFKLLRTADNYHFGLYVRIELDTTTFKRFAYLAENEPTAGIMYLTGHDLWEVKPKTFEDPWFKRILKNVSSHLSQEMLRVVDKCAQ